MHGSVATVINHSEHQRAVARLSRTRDHGRENVIAGRTWHGLDASSPRGCWAKFEAMVEGAKIASQETPGAIAR